MTLLDDHRPEAAAGAAERPAAPPGARADASRLRLFVSYARRDMAAADALVEALEAEGFEVLIDRRDLPYGEEWQAELADFIRAADTVVWLVSPASLASRWCSWELGEVQRLSKRLVPVAIDTVPVEELPEALDRIHLLPAVGRFDLGEHLPLLVATLETDWAWLKEHTRLAERARAWLGRDRAPALLLRGVALKDSETWADRRPADAPPPSDEVLDLVLASRRAQSRRQRIAIAASLAVAPMATGLAGLAWWQWGEAVAQRAVAVEQQEIAEAERDAALRTQSRFLADLARQHSARGDHGTALALALEALPDERRGIERPYVPQAEAALFEAVSDLRERAALRGHEDMVFFAAFSPDGTRVVTASEDRTARIWDTASGAEIAVLRGHEHDVGSAAFSPEGTRVTASGDFTAHIWRVFPTTQALVDHARSIQPRELTPEQRRRFFLD